MNNRDSTNVHQETLRWLDESLEWAYARNRTRLVELLNLVRIEVLFDVDFSEDPSSARNQAAESAFDANRVI